MAWSDAARAAALEARRMHSRAKSSYYKGALLSWPGEHRRSARDRIAKDLRLVRGGQFSASFASRIIKHAVASTAVRNYIRKDRKEK